METSEYLVKTPPYLIPLWCQKASNREDKMVCWDYHVIFILANCDKDSMVYDLDTTLSFPCDFKTYAGSGIRPNSILQPQFHSFGIIKADEYLSTFASDRSHMIGEDGSWMSPPPSYPYIILTLAIKTVVANDV
ncbi:hypothetical protein KUTeg_009968 [Tegillarca granosa]|uniref:Protein N-terminal glutamine amidohydrolase n=1 Tax=Tegillarca granosa TaxID=220873 RepID=A0ABQ9F8I0_TEGGR|nr:hypothetical protein KUTeg_009968 [Tegillarca granosa]